MTAVAVLTYLGLPPLIAFVSEVTLAVVFTVTAYVAGRAAGRDAGYRRGMADAVHDDRVAQLEARIARALEGRER